MRAGRPAARGTLLAILAALPLHAVFIARTGFEEGGERHFVLFDDAMISMRYGRNLADGHGLVWTPGGDAVEGYSNLLWTLWMAFVHVLPIPDSKTSLAVMITSVALLAATVWVVRGVALEVAPDRPAVAVGAAWLTALLYPLAYWSLRGMEVGLVALVVAGAVLLAARLQREPTGRRLAGLAALMALGVLVRDDVVVPCAVVLAYAVLATPREARVRTGLALAGALAGALVAHTAMRLAIYDEPLANTYHLKLSGIPLGTRLDRGATALGYTLGAGLYAPLLLAGAHLLIATGWRRWRPEHLIAAIFAAVCAYSVYVGGDAWESTAFANRYITPAIPLVLVLAVAGAAALVRSAERTRTWLCLGLAAAAVAVPVAARGWYPESLGVFRPATTFENRELAAGVLLALALAAVPLARRAAAAAPGVLAAAAGALAVACLVALQTGPVSQWADSGAQGAFLDEAWAREGLLLRRTTPGGTPVAATAVGAVSYFSRRPTIDLLGKMDPAIARGPRRAERFRPGHDKWNYEHSIGRLRPAVVVQLAAPTPAELCEIKALGYRELVGGFYVRSGARDVLTRELAVGMRTIGAGPPAGWPPACA